jgi:hypothetical protein
MAILRVREESDMAGARFTPKLMRIKTWFAIFAATARIFLLG